MTESTNNFVEIEKLSNENFLDWSVRAANAFLIDNINLEALIKTDIELKEENKAKLLAQDSRVLKYLLQSMEPSIASLVLGTAGLSLVSKLRNFLNSKFGTQSEEMRLKLRSEIDSLRPNSFSTPELTVFI